jgi:ATP-dependent exoDNAse (exonuclease V) alpha subunit
MVAHRRSDVADLNARARRRMHETGRLGAGELSAGGREYAVGDRVVATRNAYRLGIVNGEAGVVAALDPEELTLELDPGRRVRLPLEYVADGLDHGYAITAHRAQGATVDAAFVLGSDELYREWGYTALSRHRDVARFYVSARPAFLNDAPALLGTPDDVTRRVVEMLQGSRAQRLAIDDIEQPCRPARDPLEVPEVPNRSRRLTRQRGDADLGLER